MASRYHDLHWLSLNFKTLYKWFSRSRCQNWKRTLSALEPAVVLSTKMHLIKLNSTRWQRSQITEPPFSAVGQETFSQKTPTHLHTRSHFLNFLILPHSTMQSNNVNNEKPFSNDTHTHTHTHRQKRFVRKQTVHQQENQGLIYVYVSFAQM